MGRSFEPKLREVIHSSLLNLSRHPGSRHPGPSYPGSGHPEGVPAYGVPAPGILGILGLGLLGIGLGIAVGKLEIIEGLRGDLAAWLLISFGLVYAAWGTRQALRNRPHTHSHAHADGTIHDHHHQHHDAHTHVHDQKKQGLTPWALFVIFVLGPCEPLIPILMYPAARANTGGLILVTAIFATVTIGTMVAMVFLAERGIAFLPLKKLERFAHVIAGMTILSSGLAIRFLGL